MKRYLVSLALLAAITIGEAGDISRKGTTGADQLLIPVGARSISTAGAFLSNTYGAEAIYYNPAGLAGSTRSEVLFSYMNYFADINISYFATGFNVGDIGTFGISYKAIDFGNIPVTTESNPEGTGANYSPAYYTLGFTYAKTVTDRVRAGVTMKYISEGIMSTRAQGLGFDFGVQYKFVGDLSIGVAIKNIGADMVYEGQDLENRTTVPGGAPNTNGNALFSPVVEAFQLPSYFELSSVYSFNFNDNNLLMVGTTFQNNNALEDQLKLGTEYKFMNLLSLRAGYDYLLQNQNTNQYGLDYGVGIEYSMDSFLVNLDYAYRSMKDFSGNHVFAVKLSF